MALNSLFGIEYPSSMYTNPSDDNVTVDATGKKCAWIGPVHIPGGGSKNVQKVGFRTASHVVAGGSGSTVSLQNVAATTIIQPDEVQDQTVAVTPPGTAGWLITGNLSAVRAVTHGEMLAVVWEFNGGGRLGADTLVAAQLGSHGSSGGMGNAAVSLKSAGAWTVDAAVGTVALYFDDGTVGSLGYALPVSGRSTRTFNSGSTPDERGFRLRPPCYLQVDGVWALLECDTTASDFDLLIIEDDVTLQTISFDASMASVVNATRHYRFPITPVLMVPGRVYDVSFRPSTVADIVMQTFTFDSALVQALMPGGAEFSSLSRTNGGAWTETAQEHLWAGLMLSGIYDRVPPMLVNSGSVVG